MSGWTNKDFPSGNGKPKYANTSSTYGVSVTEKANNQGVGPKLTHAGWVKIETGRGPLGSITIVNPGSGINANGFLSVTGGGASRQANVSYVVSGNIVSQIIINDAGKGYNSSPTVVYTGSNTTRPTFSVSLGGRAGRVTNEVLVAMSSITNDNPGDNTILPGT